MHYIIGEHGPEWMSTDHSSYVIPPEGITAMSEQTPEPVTPDEPAEPTPDAPEQPEAPEEGAEE